MIVLLCCYVVVVKYLLGWCVVVDEERLWQMQSGSVLRFVVFVAAGVTASYFVV